MTETYRIFIGFDQREAIAFHTCVQSVLHNASVPVTITPLVLNNLGGIYKETHSDGSNDFIYSRFLVPYLTKFKGTAVFLDGDMVVETDIKQLFDQADPNSALQVVKHDYKTKARAKYLGNRNEDYPRKNWSSVILWNCEHKAHQVLRPDFVARQSGAYLHRFQWLNDADIGALDQTWNWLAEEYPSNPACDLIHYTLGTPCFDSYKNCSQSDRWHHYNSLALEGYGK